MELESGNDWYTKTAIISRIDPHFLGQHTLNQLMYAARKEDFFMWKKAMLIFGISSLLLVGCTDQDDDMNDPDQDLTPGSNDDANSMDNGTDEEKRLEEDDSDTEDTSGNE